MVQGRSGLRWLGVGLLALAVAGTSVAEEPPVLNAPEGWRSERIPFPLEFAPAIDYPGFEELRFAPGMFDPDAADYFSYVFVWFIEGRAEFDAELLDKQLEAYFEGLCTAVAQSRKLSPPAHPIEASVGQANQAGEYQARVSVWDAFTDGRPLTLRFEIRTQRCAEDACSCVLFEASPSPVDAEVWKTMRGITDAFRCEAR